MKKLTLLLAVLAIIGACACGGNSPALLAPTGLYASPSGTQVALSWYGTSGANNYNLYYSTTAGGALSGTKLSVTGTEYVHTGLQPGLTYYYALTAVRNGKESLSAGAQAHISLAAPSGVTVAATGTQVVISWTAVTGAASYNLYWANQAGLGPEFTTKISGITGTTYTHTSLTPGTNYYYTVTATDALTFDSAASAEKLATTTLATPVAVVVAGATSNTLTWAAVTGAAHYHIYWGTSSAVTPATGTLIDDVTTTSYIHSGLTTGTTYFYVVTAVSAATESLPSTLISGTVAPAGSGGTVTATATAGGTATVTTGGSTLNFTVPAGAVNQSTVITFDPMTLSELPMSMRLQRSGMRSGTTSSTADGTFIAGFKISTDLTVTAFNVPITLGGTVPTLYAPGTSINLAQMQTNAWVDVMTFVVGAGGVFTSNLPSVALPGILTPGFYLLYLPASGQNVSVSNLGIALVADDGAGTGPSYGSLQVIHLYDANGVPLATPTMAYLQFAGTYDLDGQALTPDGSQGILVDGGNTVWFFSGVQTGVPIASTKTLDVSAYGGDGDSVAIMPTGDEAVVSADDYSRLVLVSGILSGSPVIADTIDTLSYRDGLVISDDGLTLLARGSSGLTVYSITPITPVAGTIAGMVAHRFLQVSDFQALGTSYIEDGRDGMAMSSNDPTRAIVITPDNGTVTPLSGLPGTPAVGTAITITGTSLYSVAISPDGKLAVVGTSTGLILFSGVDTGTLVQVNATPFAPNYTGTSGATTLSDVKTLGITLDGKYVIACDGSSDSLLTIPFTATGFSNPVGVLTGVAVPYNDQLLIH